MNCPQCSAPINDPYAVFCAKCGTRLLVPVSQVAAPKAGWEAVPTKQVTAPDQPIASPIKKFTRAFVLKVALCAFICAALLGWATYVTMMLDRIPSILYSSFLEYRDNQSGFAYNFEQEIHMDDERAWIGACFGLVIGLVLGLVYLTRPKSK